MCTPKAPDVCGHDDVLCMSLVPVCMCLCVMLCVCAASDWIEMEDLGGSWRILESVLHCIVLFATIVL